MQVASREPLAKIMLARYYEAPLNRFLSPDPVRMDRNRLFAPQRLNLYSYAANNPLLLVDSDGQDVKLAPGFQSLISGGSRQFRQAWGAFLSSPAGKKYFGNLKDNPNTLVTVRAASDKSMDRDGDGRGDLYGETNVTKQDPATGEVKEQTIDVNFEDTGGVERLANTFLDEFIHADQNVVSEGTSTEAEDHQLMEQEKKKTDFPGEVRRRTRGSLTNAGGTPGKKKAVIIDGARVGDI